MIASGARVVTQETLGLGIAWLCTQGVDPSLDCPIQAAQGPPVQPTQAQAQLRPLPPCQLVTRQFQTRGKQLVESRAIEQLVEAGVTR